MNLIAAGLSVAVYEDDSEVTNDTKSVTKLLARETRISPI